MAKFDEDHPDVKTLKKLYDKNNPKPKSIPASEMTFMKKLATDASIPLEMSFMRRIATDASGFTNPLNYK